MSITVIEKTELWPECLESLKCREDIPPKVYNQWIKPLQAQLNNNRLVLYAPNPFVLDWINEKFLDIITTTISELTDNNPPIVELKIGSVGSPEESNAPQPKVAPPAQQAEAVPEIVSSKQPNNQIYATTSNIDNAKTFDNFVEGNSNKFARAAAQMVVQNMGKTYNPLFLYGGVGLGKTHLMHAMGNYVLEQKPNARVLYLHSERFVADMIRALQRNAMNEFKRHYRNVDALFIDDIQFFAGKDRSQEEFFHTFNALLEGHQQIVLTSDRYPKEIIGLEERLKSRFGWGLTVAIEPPELETRVAILLSKAEQANTELPSEVAFFIAKHIQSNVRELEGALKRVIANAQFTGQAITIDFARDALKDLLTLQAKLVTIENIQKTVAEYCGVKLADLLSKRRSRSIARPRQMAMSLAKQLTNHSLPEIGDKFGGRDHTTVLHACRKIQELTATNIDIQEDWKNLMRILSA